MTEVPPAIRWSCRAGSQPRPRYAPSGPPSATMSPLRAWRSALSSAPPAPPGLSAPPHFLFTLPATVRPAFEADRTRSSRSSAPRFGASSSATATPTAAPTAMPNATAPMSRSVIAPMRFSSGESSGPRRHDPAVSHGCLPASIIGPDVAAGLCNKAQCRRGAWRQGIRRALPRHGQPCARAGQVRSRTQPPGPRGSATTTNRWVSIRS